MVLWGKLALHTKAPNGEQLLQSFYGLFILRFHGALLGAGVRLPLQWGAVSSLSVSIPNLRGSSKSHHQQLISLIWNTFEILQNPACWHLNRILRIKRKKETGLESQGKTKVITNPLKNASQIPQQPFVIVLWAQWATWKWQTKGTTWPYGLI